MKLASILATLWASHALAVPAWSVALNRLASGQNPFSSAEQFLIELSPDDRLFATEEQKWQLRREGKGFFDISETLDLGFSIASSPRASVHYPSKPPHNESIFPLLSHLSKQNMKDHLTTFTSFHTRYYRSDYGRQSSEWLLAQVASTLNGTGHARPFKHSWGQNSIVATLPGRTNKTVIIGAHQDSINLFLPSILAAPGADDDGSGTVTILEALRVLLLSPEIRAGEQENAVEFHWYSAEEGGLLGSQAIFSAYEKAGRDVAAMLQQDMTGYTHATLAAGEPESVGVITDFVDPGLTTFIKEVVSTYCDIPYVETKCGAFVIESDFKYSDNKIHTTEDKIEYLDFNHMLQHGKLTLGLAYELAFAKFG
ncbi:Leucine aminopeptidase 1 [Teratosphaeriaceae sp. CCFEE 6253]|nr:Leucine aminopeptidase 1 [Teratosphaeriaceae sp. CCFEE 6253]